MFTFNKIFIYFFVLVFCFFITSTNLNAAEFNFLDTQSCGYAETEYNQCCLSVSDYNIEESDLNIAINKLKSCTIDENAFTEGEGNEINACQLTDKEAFIITQLISLAKDDKEKALVSTCLRVYLINQESDKQNNFQCNASFFGTMTIQELEDYFKSKRIIYNNLSKSEKVALQSADTLTREKCLINGLGFHGLCAKDSAGYALEQLGKNPQFKAVLEAEEDIVTDECVYGKPVKNKDETCICVAETGLSVLCSRYIEDKNELNHCIECTENKNGFWTGFGCIGLSFQGFVQETLFGWALGLAGIITLLCIIFAAFMLQTSAGNPEKVKKARQYLTACITGLLLIIFSILILRIIGVNILKIPGFI